MTESFLRKLLRSDKTVYSFKELHMLWPDTDIQNMRAQIHYYIKRGDLYHIRRGLYALSNNYDRLELATKIFIPSYVSFETVLVSAGIVFQYYKTIFVASYQSKKILCDGQNYIFKKIKDEILTNNLGIEVRDNYTIASPERALLDTLYLNKDYHFDNLSSVDWQKLYEIVLIYKNKHIEKEINRRYSKLKK
jgi:predicted transcriptional regulator of viral defense system